MPRNFFDELPFLPLGSEEVQIEDFHLPQGEGTEMVADEILFELLHSEIVNYNKNSEECLSTLEYLGFTTGYRLIERVTRECSRFKDELETVKFICTNFWTSVYKKPVDNLRTNHQGIYVIQDNDFRFLSKIGIGKQYLEQAPLYIAFTSGLLRGALCNLGINCIVTAEVKSMPTCKFQIQVQTT